MMNITYSSFFMEIHGKKIIKDLTCIGIPVDNLYYLKFLDRFKTKLVLDINTDCWNWTGAKSGRGDYGMLNFNSVNLGVDTNFQVHRLSYTLFCGKIPDGLVVRHMCNNGLCANPEHLTIGTLSENVLDTIISQRTGNGTTDDQKKDMVKMRNSGAELKEIAAKHNVSVSCVSRILGGKRKTAHLGIGVHETNYTTNRTKPPKTTKLTEENVLNVVSMWALNNSIGDICKFYGVNRSTISDIINKKSWKHVTKNIDIAPYKAPIAKYKI